MNSCFFPFTHPHRRLYWSDWNRDSPKIEMSNMDGTDRTVLVNDGIELPNGLSFDHHTRQLCWADAGWRFHQINTWINIKIYSPRPKVKWLGISSVCVNVVGTRKVECINPYTRLRRKIVEGLQYPFDIVSYGRNLYYTDWRRYRCTKRFLVWHSGWILNGFDCGMSAEYKQSEYITVVTSEE